MVGARSPPPHFFLCFLAKKRKGSRKKKRRKKKSKVRGRTCASNLANAVYYCTRKKKKREDLGRWREGERKKGKGKEK